MNRIITVKEKLTKKTEARIIIAHDDTTDYPIRIGTLGKCRNKIRKGSVDCRRSPVFQDYIKYATITKDNL